MICIELTRNDLALATRSEVRNPPGMFFSSTSPLLKPFMKKLEDLLPVEKKGRGDSYTLSMLYSQIDEVYADERVIEVKGDEKVVAITKDELSALIVDRYPKAQHQKLNLPGLLFIQSSPAVQASVISKIREKYKLRMPEGRRTLRFIFHMTITSIDADGSSMKIEMDMDRLPQGADCFETVQ
jgi:hypothetical protein